MVSGIFFKLDHPYAHFASENVTGDLLLLFGKHLDRSKLLV